MNKLVVVSLPKCGTNLIGGLLGALGYAVTGEGIDNAFPSWCRQLDSQFITSFPEKTCCFFHSLSAADIDGRLMDRWREPDSPKIIFNYRDPRAALVSMVNYLMSGKYSGAGWQQIGSDILLALPERERISFGIDYFDQFLFKKYRESAWLLKHPKVHCASFEKLVGPMGGGDLLNQTQEVEAILCYANCPISAEEVAPLVFNPSSRTFFEGRAYAWQESFAPAALEKFRSRYGDILDTFGYAD